MTDLSEATDLRAYHIDMADKALKEHCRRDVVKLLADAFGPVLLFWSAT